MHVFTWESVGVDLQVAITVTAVFTKLHIGFIFKLQKLDLKGKFLFLSQ